jgi:hypothetical protein
MAKKLFITRLSEFGTNDLIVTTGKGHVIDVLQHGCKGIDFPLCLDHALYEGRVFSLDSPAKKRRLATAVKGNRDIRLIPVRHVEISDIHTCLDDRSLSSIRTLDFVNRYFDIRSEFND